MDTTQSTTDVPLIQYADAPFDDPDADIIIRSSDNVQFRVHKVILSVASPFFKAMFSLPQPLNAEFCDGADIIPLSEDSKVVGNLLRFCYPGRGPAFANFAEARDVVAAMEKYEMGEDAKKYLLDFLKQEPLRVFATACRYKWEDIAKQAAKETLRHPLVGADVEELDHVPTRVYHRLLQYNKKCGEVSSDLTSTRKWRWINEGNRTWFGVHSNCPMNPNPNIPVRFETLKDRHNYRVAAWFVQYMESAGVLLRERPLSAMISDASFCEGPLQTAYLCPTCRPLAKSQLKSFTSVHFTNEINRVVSEVDLQLGL